MNQSTSVVSSPILENPVGVRSLDNQVGNRVLGMGREKGPEGFQEVVLALNL